MKKEVADVAIRTGNLEILEAKFNSLSNHEFHKISSKVGKEIGLPLGDRVFPEWQKWLNTQVKKKRF